MISIKNTKAYCCEDISNIENYEEAVNSPERWECHHRLETHNSDGERRLCVILKPELIALGMYYNRPASELIFIRKVDHNKLHIEMYHPRQWVKGQVAYNKGVKTGKPAWNNGISGDKYLSKDGRRRMSMAHKGKNRTCNAAYKEYKANGGTMKWNEFQKEFKKDASTLL